MSERIQWQPLAVKQALPGGAHTYLPIEVADAPLARGGFAEIFRARGDNGASYAFKKLVPSLALDLEARHRFMQEQGLLQQYPHPRLVSCLSELVIWGEHNEHVGFLLEYIPQTLAQVAKSPAWTITQTLDACIAVLEAIVHLHTNQIIHRDINPTNVLLRADKPREAKLADLGVARSAEKPAFTAPGRIIGEGSIGWFVAQYNEVVVEQLSYFVGTPTYIAPEVRNKQWHHPAADVFSFGAMLYFLCTGRHVMRKDKNGDRITFTYDFRDPRIQNPGITENLAEFMDWAVHPDHRRRADPLNLLEGLRDVRTLEYPDPAE